MVMEQSCHMQEEWFIKGKSKCKVGSMSACLEINESSLPALSSSCNGSQIMSDLEGCGEEFILNRVR